MDFNSVMQNICLCFGNSNHLDAAARRGAAPALEHRNAAWLAPEGHAEGIAALAVKRKPVLVGRGS